MDKRIIDYFSDELSEKERIALLKEAENDPSLKNDLLAYQNIKAVLSLSPENKDVAAGEKEYKNLFRMQQRKKRVFFVKKAIGYAAAIGLIVVSTWMVASFNQKQTQIEISQQELFAPPGQRARITLSDGSVVWLNAGSTLHYPSFFEKERKVELSGEAYFDVAKDTEKPFIVSTKNLEIKALGTQFNVHSYPKAKYETASLVQGSIKVYKQGAELQGTLLSPNQQLHYSDGKFVMETVDKDELLWKEGIYSFKRARLDHIVKKLELYYDVDIIVEDPRILRYEYTGKFRQRDGIMDILRIIQKIHHFKIEKNEDLNQITITQ